MKDKKIFDPLKNMRMEVPQEEKEKILTEIKTRSISETGFSRFQNWKKLAFSGIGTLAALGLFFLYSNFSTQDTDNNGESKNEKQSENYESNYVIFGQTKSSGEGLGEMALAEDSGQKSFIAQNSSRYGQVSYKNVYSYTGPKDQISQKAEENIYKIEFEKISDNEISTIAKKFGFSDSDKVSEICDYSDNYIFEAAISSYIEPSDPPAKISDLQTCVSENNILYQKKDGESLRFEFYDGDFGGEYIGYSKGGANIYDEMFSNYDSLSNKIETSKNDAMNALKEIGIINSNNSKYIEIDEDYTSFICGENEYVYYEQDMLGENENPIPTKCAKYSTEKYDYDSVTISTRSLEPEISTNIPKPYSVNYTVKLKIDGKVADSLPISIHLGPDREVLHINTRNTFSVEKVSLPSSDANDIFTLLQQDKVKPIDYSILYDSFAYEETSDDNVSLVTNTININQVGISYEQIYSNRSIYFVPSYNFEGEIIYGEETDLEKSRNDMSAKTKCENLKSEMDYYREIPLNEVFETDFVPEEVERIDNSEMIEIDDTIQETIGEKMISEPYNPDKENNLEEVYQEYYELNCWVFDEYYEPNPVSDYVVKVPAFSNLEIELGE